MAPSFTGAVRDSLSNLAASLGAGKDKAALDAFSVFDLGRSQVEAMYRGDWLARKVVDIVPYDMVREWREWSGHPGDVARIAAVERRLGLRKALQRAMTLGRLYGGGALIIGTGESDPAALAPPLDPDRVGRGGPPPSRRGSSIRSSRRTGSTQMPGRSSRRAGLHLLRRLSTSSPINRVIPTASGWRVREQSVPKKLPRGYRSAPHSLAVQPA